MNPATEDLIELRYWPDTSPKELSHLMRRSEVADADGFINESAMLEKARIVWPRHHGGWVSVVAVPPDAGLPATCPTCGAEHYISSPCNWPH